MSTDLDSMIGELQEFLGQAEALRGTLTEATTQSVSLVQKLEKIDADVDHGIGGAEAFVSNIDAVLRPGVNPPAGDASASAARLEQVLNEVAAYKAEIIPADMLSQVSNFETGDIAGKLKEAMEQYSAKIADALEWIDERLATLVEASDTILEKATEFSEGVDTAKDMLTEKTSDVAESVQELISALDALSSGRQDDLVGTLTSRLEEQISGKIESVTGGALESVASLNNKAEALTGNIVDQLSAINDTFGKVLDIAEPVRPVIEMAASIA